VHGDVADGNLLTEQGRLSAVIDFGCCAVGDPACDTVIAWTYFSGGSHEVFKERLPVDRAAWVRGRGWALWKAMIVLVGALRDDPEDAIATRRVLAEVLGDDLRT
jgi:aminoglycoside phosphotransferase (APT) family kinase protein